MSPPRRRENAAHNTKTYTDGAARTFQARERLLDRDVDLALLHRRAQVCVRERPRVVLAALLREREHDDGQQRLLAQVPEQVHVQVLVRLVERALRASAATSRATAGGCITAPALPAASRLASAPGLASALTTPLGRACAGAELLYRGQPSRLPLLVLFPPQCFSGALVPVK